MRVYVHFLVQLRKKRKPRSQPVSAPDMFGKATMLYNHFVFVHLSILPCLTTPILSGEPLFFVKLL